MQRTKTFFAQQHELLGGLLGWGVGSIVIGAGLLGDHSPVGRQIGLQALTWGAIDALLAWAGRRGARQRSELALSDRPDPDELKAAASFERLVAINAGLDLLYIVGGSRLARTADPRRRGVGLGILPQGGFLLIYDLSLLAWVRRWRVRYDR